MPFSRRQGRLLANDIPLSDIAASVGTPCYVYIWDDIRSRFQSLREAVSSHNVRICYAVKANSNLSLLEKFHSLDAGFDLVSAGELERVLHAGGDPSRVVFSGVGKTREEISFALKVGIGHFNVESESEAACIESVAQQLGLTANVVVRINPDIEVDTHRYITTGLKENKFGLPEQEALALASKVHREFQNCNFQGIACHIGSQLVDLEPYAAAIDCMLEVRDSLIEQQIPCSTIDLGGGFGISYEGGESFDFKELGRLFDSRELGETLIELEPGRSLVGDAGVLLTHVEHLKRSHADSNSNFCIVNAAMNDLLRPALYDAYHEIVTVEPDKVKAESWNVVGPVCETADFLGNLRMLSVESGDLLAIRSVGAYGFVLSSNYNSRPRSAEVLVDGDSFSVVRRRESIHDLIHLEQPLS